MAKVDFDSIQPNSEKERRRAAAQAEKTSIDGAGSDKKERKDREKVKPVVKKDAVVSTKKPLGQRIKSAFISKDGEDIKTYVIREWLIPGIKDGILDILSIMFFDEVREKRSRGRGRDRERTSYSSYYGGSRYSSSSSRSRDRRYEDDDKVDYRNIILRERREAEKVVDEMCRRIEEDGQVTVADLLDLIDVSSRYTDNNWGWTKTRDIGIRRVRDGFLIDVAEARYLDD